MVTQKKVPDRLIDPTCIRNMFNITPNLGVMTLGLTRKCKQMQPSCSLLPCKQLTKE